MIDVGTVIRFAIEAIPEANVTLVVPPETIAVRADPGRIEQVMTNLVDNAVKSSPSGAEISVAVSVTELEALVEVSDRGAGMTEEQAARAFDKFARGRDQSVEGTGLGLYISKSIVDAHGGRIWVARRPVGTSICFTLPLGAAETDGATPAGDRANAIAGADG